MLCESWRSPKSRRALSPTLVCTSYDSSVFELIPTLERSTRGELEITDVNNWYVEQGTMAYDIAEGFWGDAGESIDAFYEVNDYVRSHGANR